MRELFSLFLIVLIAGQTLASPPTNEFQFLAGFREKAVDVLSSNLTDQRKQEFIDQVAAAASNLTLEQRIRYIAHLRHELSSVKGKASTTGDNLINFGSLAAVLGGAMFMGAVVGSDEHTDRYKAKRVVAFILGVIGVTSWIALRESGVQVNFESMDSALANMQSSLDSKLDASKL